MYSTAPEVRDCTFEEFQAPFTHSIETLVLLEGMEEDARSQQERNQGTSEGPRLDRVRINSAHVIDRLARVTGQSEWQLAAAMQPITFLRPFSIFVLFFEDMEQHLRALKKKLLEEDGAESAQVSS